MSTASFSHIIHQDDRSEHLTKYVNTENYNDSLFVRVHVCTRYVHFVQVRFLRTLKKKETNTDIKSQDKVTKHVIICSV